MHGGCAQVLCAKVARACRGCARLYAQRRMVVRALCARRVPSLVRFERHMQGFCVVQDSPFSVAQGFRPLCEIYFVDLFLLNIVLLLVM